MAQLFSRGAMWHITECACHVVEIGARRARESMAHGQRGSAVVQALRLFSCAASPRGSARAACLLCRRLASDLLPLTCSCPIHRSCCSNAASTSTNSKLLNEPSAAAGRLMVCTCEAESCGLYILSCPADQSAYPSRAAARTCFENGQVVLALPLRRFNSADSDSKPK